jgi:uncharacterized protein YjiS (DUF1127 family)
MSDIAYPCRSSSFPKRTTLASITAMSKMVVAVMREWRRRYRSRQELASYSSHERNDLRFAADVDAEISKPFWKK